MSWGGEGKAGFRALGFRVCKVQDVEFDGECLGFRSFELWVGFRGLGLRV